MPRLRVFIILAIFFFISGCETVPQERQREAKLMPREVAMQLVSRHATERWARNPVLYPQLINHPFCSDEDKFPRHTPYSDMSVTKGKNVVIVIGKEKASFWCGTDVVFHIRTQTAAETEDLFDAFLSLEAKAAIIWK